MIKVYSTLPESKEYEKIPSLRKAFARAYGRSLLNQRTIILSTHIDVMKSLDALTQATITGIRGGIIVFLTFNDNFPYTTAYVLKKLGIPFGYKTILEYIGLDDLLLISEAGEHPIFIFTNKVPNIESEIPTSEPSFNKCHLTEYRWNYFNFLRKPEEFLHIKEENLKILSRIFSLIEEKIPLNNSDKIVLPGFRGRHLSLIFPPPLRFLNKMVKFRDTDPPLYTESLKGKLIEKIPIKVPKIPEYHKIFRRKKLLLTTNIKNEILNIFLSLKRVINCTDKIPVVIAPVNRNLPKNLSEKKSTCTILPIKYRIEKLGETLDIVVFPSILREVYIGARETDYIDPILLIDFNGEKPPENSLTINISSNKGIDPKNFYELLDKVNKLIEGEERILYVKDKSKIKTNVPRYNRNLCDFCMECINLGCDAIVLENNNILVVADKCTKCNACVNACTREAIFSSHPQY